MTSEQRRGEYPIRKGKPHWLKRKLPTGPEYEQVRKLLKSDCLTTVCQEAQCPNQFECFSRGTATFMILGDACTRDCAFCAVGHQPDPDLDESEPERVAAAVKKMGLRYAVITSVTRDDLPDGGATVFARTIKEIRRISSDTLIEVLIPDLQGDWSALEIIVKAGPDVLNHNIETVERLYPTVRPQAIYQRSIELLKEVKRQNKKMVTKSGVMLGLGEIRKELSVTIADLRKVSCDILTLGQYLQPSKNHLPVVEFVTPEEFNELGKIAMEKGFAGVASGPSVRSSYEAEKLYRDVMATLEGQH